jgi:hypothetical protein
MTDTLSTPHLEFTCPPEVAAAAASLVATKDEIDQLGRSSAGTTILGQLFPDWQGYRSIGPHCFATQVLPFFRHARVAERASGVRHKALVPTAQVIGENWRWWPHNLDECNQLRVIEKTTSAFNASTPGHAESECPQYTHIKPLGIILAHEGKNRVALFKERAIAHIPALVSEEDYPSPNRIRIFELDSACLAVLDGRFVERVKALNLVRRLMETYGIAVEKRWPAEYAALDEVLADLDDTRYKHDWEPHLVDMDRLKLDAAANDVEVDATLLDLGHVKLPALGTWIRAAAALPILLLVMKFAQGRWPDLQFLASMLVGALCMLLAVPLLPLVRTKVRYLDDRGRINEFFTAKRQLEANIPTQSLKK